jgi:methylenetetrahydrofolate--tRNA-(uracil-5-)-methyltransferase
LGELVCSNSLKSTALTNASGILKAELAAAGSLVLDSAMRCRVPAGSALAVDRVAMAEMITRKLAAHPGVDIERRRVDELPDPPAIIATGPLTEGQLADRLAEAAGEPLHFYDAIAPILEADSLLMEHAFIASRWETRQEAAGEGGGSAGQDRGDYINCPLSREGYEELVADLLTAKQVEPHEFEKPRYFEACLPVEIMASRGIEVLRHGPMRPVGLTDPTTGKWPHAVVQLRAENREGTAYNMVGFQTRLTYGEQKRVFRKIPALREARFLRLGSIHRNTYLRAPSALDDRLHLLNRPGVAVAGLLSGVEGYVESVAMGWLVAVMMAADLSGHPIPPPPATTATGGLYGYLRRQRDPQQPFAPTNMNMSLLPPVEEAWANEAMSDPAARALATRGGKKKRPNKKKLLRLAAARRALSHLEAWLPRPR